MASGPLGPLVACPQLPSGLVALPDPLQNVHITAAPAPSLALFYSLYLVFLYCCSSGRILSFIFRRVELFYVLRFPFFSILPPILPRRPWYRICASLSRLDHSIPFTSDNLDPQNVVHQSCICPGPDRFIGGIEHSRSRLTLAPSRITCCGQETSSKDLLECKRCPDWQ